MYFSRCRMAEHSSDFFINVIYTILKILCFVYDVFTLPLYFMLQRPWAKKCLAEIQRSKIIQQDDESITYASAIRVPRKHHIIMEREEIDTLAKMLHVSARKYGTKPFLGTRKILSKREEVQPSGRIFKKYVLGDYKWMTFADAERDAASFGRGLRVLGLEPHENIVIFAETRAEWIITVHGCFKHNINPVILYSTLGEEGIVHGINEVEVTTVITTNSLLIQFKNVLAKTPKVKNIIYMEDQLQNSKTAEIRGVTFKSYREVIRSGEVSSFGEVTTTADDIALIMYTSGSTGKPKGVMMTHKNITCSVKSFTDCVDISENDSYMAYLPLAHIFEFLAECVALMAGMSVGYSTSLTMMDTSSMIEKGTKGDITILRPTIFLCVPLVLERISKEIVTAVNKETFLKRGIFKFAFNYRKSWMQRGFDTPILNRIVFKYFKNVLGGRVRYVLCGGAPLSSVTQEFIRVCFCLDLLPGYGLTESCSSATVTDEYDMSTGRVGGPTILSHIRLINWDEGNYSISDRPFPRGEIIVGGDNIALGYYKMPDLTDEGFFNDEGKRWFRTQDIGEMHSDGVLKIIDRKKDLVKLQLGEYVSLVKVETALKLCPIVENICVYADSLKEYPVALVVPNTKILNNLAIEYDLRHLSIEELCENSDVKQYVLRQFQDFAKVGNLEKFEIPKAVTICTETWLPDSELLTASFKLKRRAIQNRYQKDIDRMYDELNNSALKRMP